MSAYNDCGGQYSTYRRDTRRVGGEHTVALFISQVVQLAAIICQPPIYDRRA